MVQKSAGCKLNWINIDRKQFFWKKIGEILGGNLKGGLPIPSTKFNSKVGITLLIPNWTPLFSPNWSEQIFKKCSLFLVFNIHSVFIFWVHFFIPLWIKWKEGAGDTKTYLERGRTFTMEFKLNLLGSKYASGAPAKFYPIISFAFIPINF